MKVGRRHTKLGRSPYSGAEVLRFRDNRFPVDLEFPAHWSAASQNFFAEQCIVHDGIACDLAPVPEDDVPSWLWRHLPGNPAKGSRGETSVGQVIDRLCGSWSYHGWKGGYFDSEADARAFYDECRWLLFHQNFSPDLQKWCYTGRFWAYGHDQSDPSSYITDYRSGAVRRADQFDAPPHGMVVNATSGTLTGNGGVWDLWHRESEILCRGGNCGVNVSELLSAPDSQNGKDVADILHIGDSMAASVSRTESSAPLKRRLTIDGSCPNSETIAGYPADQTTTAEIMGTGSALAKRHIQAIIDASGQSNGSQTPTDRSSVALQFALQSARQALLPEQLIEKTQRQVEQGLAYRPEDILALGGLERAPAAIPSASGAVTTIRVTDGFLAQDIAGPGQADRLIDAVTRNVCSGHESGLHFEDSANAWNTCKNSGDIRSAAGDGSHMFLDDTASDLWVLNAPAFLSEKGGFDIPGFRHAAALLTITADLSLMTSTAITPRLARRIWDYRPVSLSLTGQAQTLMALGLAYDSSAGRAVCAGLNNLLTASAYRTSAELAAELGPFPEHSKNAAPMGRVLAQHHELVADFTQEGVPPNLVTEAEQDWRAALRLGATAGFRNAQVSVLSAADSVSPLLDRGPVGLQPVSSLITTDGSAAGFFQLGLNPAVPHGLRALGYDERQIDDMTRHILGHGSLAKAPGVNHETLRKRGFTEAAIEAVEIALSQVNDISQAFTPAVLGKEYCQHMLGFSYQELADDRFDMLAALGFSDAGIEAANIYCCGAGSLEGAPHLEPEHLAVFDCETPQGDRGARSVPVSGVLKMMGAIQPHISGAIGQPLLIPHDAPWDDFRAILRQAWQLGLKSVTLKRRASDQTDGVEWYGGMLPVPPLAVIHGGQSPTFSHTGPDREYSIPTEAHHRTDVADGTEKAAGDAEAPHRATSSPAVRSTVSVSSSADTVVEQRQV